MKIETIQGEVFQFLVESEHGRGTYRVDLLAYQGNGECHCTDFNTRRRAAITSGKPLFSPATLCKHLRAVHDMVHEQTMREIAANHQKNDSRRNR